MPIWDLVCLVCLFMICEHLSEAEDGWINKVGEFEVWENTEY